ncbi:MAG TPA: AI-2E family transporter [Anaerolineales bacterium]|nr:AI-2E family transporter [Anaerolineales bacterium]
MSQTTSPNWNSTIKLVVGLTIAGMFAVLLITFRNIIGPLLLAFIVAYLIHPIALRLSGLPHLSWRAAVNLIYIILILLILGASTLTGLAVVQQTQSLIRALDRILTDLPSLLDQLSTQSLIIGPFQLHFSQFTDLGTIGDELISNLQGLVGRAGSLVGTFASGAASTLAWGLFILVVSYFILADAGKVPDAITFVDLPGYAEDIRRMSRELGRIWNAYLRGQIIVIIVVIIAFTVLLSILGVRFAFALALLAGVARLVPYVGPWVNWIIMALVAFFQPSNYFGLEPWQYTVLVLALSIILDQIFDNIISPRILGSSLGVHPAAVLVVAIISANLIGLVGLVLAAPVLASLKLIGRYVMRKMFDLNPWPEPEGVLKPFEIPWVGRIIRRLRAWWRKRRAA